MKFNVTPPQFFGTQKIFSMLCLKHSSFFYTFLQIIIFAIDVTIKYDSYSFV